MIIKPGAHLLWKMCTVFQANIHKQSFSQRKDDKEQKLPCVAAVLKNKNKNPLSGKEQGLTIIALNAVLFNGKNGQKENWSNKL